MKMTGKQRLVAIVLTMSLALSLLAGASVLVGAGDIPTSGSISDLTAVYTYVENEDELGTLQIDATAVNIEADEYVMFYIYENVEDISDPTNSNTNLQTTTKGFYASSLVEGTALSKELQLTPLKLNGKCVLGIQISNRGEGNDWLYAYITTALIIDPNGGENIGENTLQVRLGFGINSELDGKELVSKDRCELVGWGEVPEGPAIGDDVTMTPYGYTVYALWEINKFDITFNSGDGCTGEMPPQTVDKNVPTPLDDCAFERYGYEFAGWATEPDGEVVYDNEETVTVGEDIALYAVWTKLYGTVIFNANGGDGSMDPMSIGIGDTVNLTENAFTNNSFRFAGWATETDGGVVYVNKAPITMSGSELQLYAVWVESSAVTVRFFSNGGEGLMNSQFIEFGTTAALSTNMFTRYGYAFIGWALTEDGDVAYADKADFTAGEDDVDLYAVWKRLYASVLFNPNGGEGYKKPQTVPLGDTVALEANVFYRTGYSFKGWSLTPGGAVAYEDCAQCRFTKPNQVFYAVWGTSDSQCAILFNPNGGEGYKKPQKYIPSGSTVALDANVFTRNGYNFIGWSTTPTGSVEYRDGAAYTVGTKNDVLYAVWQANGLQTSAAPKAGWHMTAGSDAVTVVDALATLRGAVGIEGIDEVMLYEYDFDGDGWLTVADALIILRISVGL